jgi:uncharacterized protein
MPLQHQLRARAALSTRAPVPITRRPSPLLLLPTTSDLCASHTTSTRATPAHGNSASTTTTTTTTGTSATDDEQDYELVLQVAQSIGAVPAGEWDALAVAAAGGPQRRNPFVSHSFLLALEESGSAQPRTGWAPQHLLVRLRPRGGGSSSTSSSSSSSDPAGALVGCAPVYLKGNSAGEYVFDHSWAQFHEAHGGNYYPKLVCGVPFSPVTGPRIMAGGPALEPVARQLWRSRNASLRGGAGGGDASASAYSLEAARRDAARAVQRALAGGLRELAREYQCSSAHVNFLTAEEQALLVDLGQEEEQGGGGRGNGRDAPASSSSSSPLFMPRFGWQYHFDNRGYSSFADFEADLRQSKRKSVRQERKAVAKQGLALKRRRGDELSSDEWSRFHDFYLDTVDRRWGNAYLTRDFFARLGEERELAEQVLMVTAHEGGGGGGGKGGSMIAGALNLVGGDCIYGRNWGAAPGRADSHPFLHFALCYYEAIEHAIEAGLARVEAGAQGEHKLQRGYLPTLTRSCHYIRAEDGAGTVLKGAVSRFLRGEAREVAGVWARLSTQASPFKEEATAALVGQRAREYLAAGGSAVPGDLAAAAAALSSMSVDGSE